MSNLNLPARDIIRSVKRKLRLRDVTTTFEQHGDYYLDGKLELRVTLPNEHGGSSTAVSPGVLKVCRESVLLNASEFARLIRCPMTAEEYDAHIRARLSELDDEA